MAILRLAVCISGVYATFLLWAIAQEQISSASFPSRYAEPLSDGKLRPGEKFPSPIFLTYSQAVASSLCAAVYLVFTAWRDGSLGKRSLGSVLGLEVIKASLRDARATALEAKEAKEAAEASKGKRSEGQGPEVKVVPWSKTLPALLGQVALFQTMASPIGFLALEHISYPTMVLGKSCKLIPVMFLNVLLYRRRFSAHKYVVVALVTTGISLFMLLGDKKKKKGGNDSMAGFFLLLVNLIIDGLTNSTQDQIFSKYPAFTGQQMMLVMAALTQLILLPFLVLPLPTHPTSLLSHLPAPFTTNLLPSVHTAPLAFSTPAALESLSFLASHPTAIPSVLSFACLGGLGQLFIFETIQHFGSLTLVMVTVTRKLFTMLLSVVVFNHQLSKPQWVGVAVVFLGIGIEAGIKRRDVMRRARRDKS